MRTHYFPVFFFGFHFLNGLGGNALFGTFRMAFIASLNLSNASGPSIISGVLRFIDSMIRLNHQPNRSIGNGPSFNSTVLALMTSSTS